MKFPQINREAEGMGGGEGEPPADGGTPPPEFAGIPEGVDWKMVLPEDIRDNPNFQKYTSMESFAKGHLNAVGMLGKQPELAVPENEDERAEFFNKLGRPEESSAYDFKQYEGISEDAKEYVETRTADFKAKAHELGLSQQQAAQLYEWYMDHDQERTATITETSQRLQQEAETALKNEWGDAYDANINAAKTALAEFGDEDLVNYLEQTGLGDNPAMIKAFNKIGRSMLGDKGLEGSAGDVLNSASIDAQVKEIMAKNEYWDADSPERPALVKKVQTLMSQMHPE